MLAAAVVTALLAAGGLKLGEPAPPLVLKDGSGARVSLAEFRGKRNVLVLPPARGEPARETAARLAALDTVALKLDDLAPPEPAAASVLLVDREGRLRRIQRGDAGLLEIIETWRLGRATYTSVCVRCHGEDGNSELYLDIKKLGGIGNRLTEAEVRSRIFTTKLGPDQFIVRGYFLNRRELDALIVYVAGL